MLKDNRVNKYDPDIIIIGAGISGCTLANIMASNKWKVLILEKRDHIGGNCADYAYENYFVNKYGPHVFHTSESFVWNYLSNFTNFNNYINTPLVIGEGYPNKIFNLPFNMNMFSEFYGEYNPENIKQIIENDIFEYCSKLNIDRNNPKNLEEQAISLVGNKLYKTFIEQYNKKQWGKECVELDASIIKRLPLRYSFNNNYFNDQYQGIPIDGYSNMMNRMIDSKYITLRLGINFKDIEKEIIEYVRENKIPLVYTGPIDEFFDYKHGELEWRTVEYITEQLDCPNYQGNAVINYACSNIEYTKSIEYKHFYCIRQDEIYESNHTIVSFEKSMKWQKGMEPYYPIQNDKNNEILEKYFSELSNYQHLYMLGRLAEYRYKDMSPSIEDAIKLSWQLLQNYK